MGGFGGKVKTPKKKGKGNKRGAPPPKPAAATRVRESKPAKRALTEEQVREAHMASVQHAIELHAASIAEGLEEHGYAVVDEFMSSEAVATMRAEAAALLAGGHMQPSQSTRYDEESGAVVAYEKHNVLSTNLVGGEAYHVSPRMHEYCVALVSSLAARLNAHGSLGVRLSETLHANKLAVCLGDGSRYDKHYDNMGDGDLRKLTALLYLQRSWTEANGGCFRMYTRGEGERDAEGELPYVDLPPLGGRLLVFLADEMVHGVNPSHASGGEDEHRWALTIWLQATDPQGISFDPAMEERHFQGMGSALAG